MLFSSSEFLFIFLPASVIGFFVIARYRHSWALGWLNLVSLFFYGWWRVEYVPLLVLSVLFNYAVGHRLQFTRSAALYWFGIGANVALLAYFKYVDFMLTVVNDLGGRDFAMTGIVLPLAISFFTFQQIAYLTDIRAGIAPPPGLLKYGAFITFFPHLIAGPITHNREMIPQFEDERIFRFNAETFVLGLTIVIIGLFKKTVIADGVAEYATPVFSAAAAGEIVTFVEAWAGALAYALQLYFDFSGYSDMAIGLALLFGIRLPLNFDSPYRACSIIEFWSRWHITLTRFLTAYVYTPLVLTATRRRMARKKPVLRRGAPSAGAFAALVAVPTMATFLLSGVWHGAGYQFLIWGLLHGVFVTVNQLWRQYKSALGVPPGGSAAQLLSWCLTFTCVVVALVFFRSADLPTALRMICAMIGEGGVVLPSWYEYPAFLVGTAERAGIRFDDLTYFWGRGQLLSMGVLLGAVLLLPNTQQWVRLYRPALGQVLKPSWLEYRRMLPRRLVIWRPAPVYGFAVGVAAFLTLLRTFSDAPTEFLYFAF